MNKDILKYKGYAGSIEISLADGCLHGQILFIDDLITYEGETVPELQKGFASSVDRYLAYCNKKGKPANKPYSGTFNVRIGQELHRKAAQEARKRNISLNDYVSQAVHKAVDQNDILKVEHTHHHCFTTTGERTPEHMFASTDKQAAWEEVLIGPLQ